MTAPGDRVAGRYVIGPPLGVGGMGQIWQATDARLNREVALKLIRPDRHGDDAAARRRFYREARVLGRLRHPGIPALYDFGVDGADLFIVMELVRDAVCLRDLVAEQAPALLPVPWAAVIGAQMCAALAAAHRAGLIHRDLTPANVVLARDGTVKILDFGVAAALDSGDFSEITRPGEAPGSLRYMAPEIDGHTRADVRSDLYAVGCVLFELLTGKRVFQSSSVMDEIARHRDEPPPPLVTDRDDVPRPLEHLVHALLAKDPAARPGSSTEVFAALLPYAQDVPPLPGYVKSDPADPAHLYTTALTRLPLSDG
ncbi:serine/threonine-protein kinase [Actinomadura sp. NPDC047616]|uniref:serine/threonine-protein kinase n=1 Tax=Actinomadura sp. NPDC047616 TaxID=3155914 RepID=UPI00341137E4